MKHILIAKNSEGDGMLPMKQSGDLEAKKSVEQRNIELCNFIKNAFCASGDVRLYHGSFKSDVYFEIQDNIRGVFKVSISSPQP